MGKENKFVMFATLGKFYVSFNEISWGGQFFEDVKEGLDFYVGKLKEIELFNGA